VVLQHLCDNADLWMVVFNGYHPRKNISHQEPSEIHQELLIFEMNARFKHTAHLMMLDASSASGSAQYLLAKIRQASADSIYETRD